MLIIAKEITDICRLQHYTYGESETQLERVYIEFISWSYCNSRI